MGDVLGKGLIGRDELKPWIERVSDTTADKYHRGYFNKHLREDCS
jgi:hypothetical protein